MQLTSDHYTVAWLCALPQSELLAAVCSLDEEHDPPELQMEDFNNYHYGTIKGHNIVIACMPPGDPGTLSANSLVHSMRINFHNLKIHLFVGIGGGVPYSPPRQDAESDIHLGDVVIGWSEEVGGPAIVQYDLGRNRETDFQMTSHFDRPGRSLTTAFGTILMNHRRRRTKFGEHLNNLITQNPEFGHPGLSKDKLFRADCLHGNAEDCSNCPTSGLVDRPPRKEAKFVFHQSTIASGNSVIKNASERDRISALCKNARCFEMEAAGVMNEIRPLVIRGIADYADGHKNWKWHDYAAATAAVFAKEFLYTITPVAVKGLKAIAPQNDFDPKEILQSLQTFINNPRFSTISEPFEGTYDWIWNTRAQNGPGFVEWLNEGCDKIPYNRRIFWIRGKPGAGKSTLIRNIAQTLEEQHKNSPMVPNERRARYHTKSGRFFFSRLGSDNEQSFERMLLASLAQICHTYPEIVPLISSIFEGLLDRGSPGSKPKWTEIAAKEALDIIGRQQMLEGSVILYIDGLDECGGDMDQHLEYLTNFIKSNSRMGTLEIKACIASREPDIQRWLHQFPGFAMHERTAPDILQYISGHLVGTAVESLQFSTIDRLKKDIVRKAEGVFIWVKVVVQEILTQAWVGERDEAILTILSELPDDIMDLYDVIISIIERSGYLHDAALWLRVLFEASNPPPHASKQTLAVIDLSYVDDGPETALNKTGNWSNKKDMIITSKGMERKLRKRCRDLIQIPEYKYDMYGKTNNALLPVYKRHCLLIHSTIREYMETKSWQERMLRLGDAVNEERIQISLMTIYLRRAQQDTRWDSDRLNNIFVHARLYEYASDSASTPFLESLDNTMKMLEPTWYRDYLSNKFSNIDPSLLQSYMRCVSLKDVGIFSKAIKSRVHLFVENILQSMNLCDIQQPLLHIIFGLPFVKQPQSLEMLETLLKNGFPVNATMPGIDREPERDRCHNVLDTLLSHGGDYFELSGDMNEYYNILRLLLKYGANVSGSFECNYDGENRDWNRCQRFIYLIEGVSMGYSTEMKLTEEEITKEEILNTKELFRVLLQSGGDLDFCRTCHAAEDQPSNKMNQIIDSAIRELDSSDADWRIMAKREGIRRAENAAKEAARWEKIWEQRIQAWQIKRNQGFFDDLDVSDFSE